MRRPVSQRRVRGAAAHGAGLPFDDGAAVGAAELCRFRPLAAGQPHRLRVPGLSAAHGLLHVPGHRPQLPLPPGTRHGPKGRGRDPRGPARGPRHVCLFAQLQGRRHALLEPVLRRLAAGRGRQHCQLCGCAVRGQPGPNRGDQGARQAHGPLRPLRTAHRAAPGGARAQSPARARTAKGPTSPSSAFARTQPPRRTTPEAALRLYQPDRNVPLRYPLSSA
mmetsp:Transcript_29548/g.99502  ORF Transcript_29548/g.99502 Transcript_29548/m.99502 type:complete len:221 (-) Transcript_29548:41-703(-)